MRDILFLLCAMLTICAGVFCLLKLIAADIRTAKETFRKFPEWKRQTIAILQNRKERQHESGSHSENHEIR